MGGSSLAPEVLRRTFERRVVPRPRHHASRGDPPARARARPRATLFLVSSKSGSTIETRSHLEYFWEQTGGRGAQFVAITDPGSELEQLAHERGFRAIFAGEPEIGGRYSALSMFGIVPAALMGVDLERFLQVAAEMVARLPGATTATRASSSASRLGEGWKEGRDKVCIDETADRLRALGGAAGRGVDRQAGEGARAGSRRAARRARPPARRGRARRPVRRSRAEFYRWEFATAVAGHVLGINPFDQPDVQAAKDKTSEVLAGGRARPLAARLARRAARRRRGGTDYVCIQAFIDPAREQRARAARRACARDGLRRHARARPALPALDRPAAQGRAEHRPLRPGRRRHRRRAGDPRPRLRLRPPDPLAGGGRLRGARGARPARRSGSDWRISRCSSEWSASAGWASGMTKRLAAGRARR